MSDYIRPCSRVVLVVVYVALLVYGVFIVGLKVFFKCEGGSYYGGSRGALLLPYEVASTFLLRLRDTLKFIYPGAGALKLKKSVYAYIDNILCRVYALLLYIYIYIFASKLHRKTSSSKIYMYSDGCKVQKINVQDICS